MRFGQFRTLVVAAAGALLINACGMSDGPFAPQQAAPTNPASRSLLSSSVTVTPLNRTKPLAKPITTSASVGVLGGKLSIPEAGLTVIVPPLALKSAKLVTITALAGSSVAYTFEPQGTTFLVPLVVTQDLRNTDAKSSGLINPLSLFVGYFPDNKNILSVTELLNVGVNLLNQSATFTVTHFSGYIVASGRQEEE